MLTEGLEPGAGVTMTAIRRHLDENLENRLRMAIGDAASTSIQQQVLSGIEALFDDLNGTGLSAPLSDFFNNLAEVQNNPTDSAIREVAVSSAAALAATLQNTRGSLISLVDSYSEQVTSAVEQADALASRLADLNAEIIASESGGRSLNGALRDQRDAALRELSEILDVNVRIQANGSFNIYVGNEALVQNGVSRGLVAEESIQNGLIVMSVRFADTNSQVAPQGGQLYGLLTVGTSQAVDWIAKLDQLAGALIAEVNRIHADGQGLEGFESLISAAAVPDVVAPLNDPNNGLFPPPTNGSFYIAVTDDATDTTVGYQIEVDLDGIDTDTSLISLADSINATVVGVTASLTADGRLSLTAETGTTFSFGTDGQVPREDTSGALAALGLNTFFVGSSAADIAVNPEILANSNRLAASLSGLAGDGNNAGELAAVAEQTSDLLNGADPTKFYLGLAGEIAVTTASARDGAEAAETVAASLQAQKESISGVSLDEEAIELIKFERAFQGAARYVAVVDRTLNELMNLI